MGFQLTDSYEYLSGCLNPAFSAPSAP